MLRPHGFPLYFLLDNKISGLCSGTRTHAIWIVYFLAVRHGCMCPLILHTTFRWTLRHILRLCFSFLSSTLWTQSALRNTHHTPITSANIYYNFLLQINRKLLKHVLKISINVDRIQILCIHVFSPHIAFSHAFSTPLSDLSAYSFNVQYMAGSLEITTKNPPTAEHRVIRNIHCSTGVYNKEIYIIWPRLYTIRSSNEHFVMRRENIQ